MRGFNTQYMDKMAHLPYIMPKQNYGTTHGNIGVTPHIAGKTSIYFKIKCYLLYKASHGASTIVGYIDQY